MARKPNMKYLKDDRPANKSRARLIVSLAGLFGLLLVVIYFFFSASEVVIEEKEEPVTLPNFNAIKDISERKKAFFDFLLPYIENSNEQILILREEVKTLKTTFEQSNDLSESAVQRVRELQAKYKLDTDDGIEAQSFLDLLSRIDVIPPSLALAQAALESGWGTSRFARKGNNLYGIWCYELGCGMVPKKRTAGKKHEVQTFLSPKGCFDSYAHNLNTNPSYGRMRAIRRALRRNGKELAGVDLAEGMERYSEEGYYYVEKVQRVIRSNALEQFDS